VTTLQVLGELELGSGDLVSVSRPLVVNHKPLIRRELLIRHVEQREPSTTGFKAPASSINPRSPNLKSLPAGGESPNTLMLAQIREVCAPHLFHWGSGSVPALTSLSHVNTMRTGICEALFCRTFVTTPLGLIKPTIFQHIFRPQLYSTFALELIFPVRNRV